MTEEEYLDSLPNESEQLALKYEREVIGVIALRLSYDKIKKISEEDKTEDLNAIKKIGLYYTAKIIDNYRKTLLKSANHLQDKAKYLYDYKGIEQIPVVGNKFIKEIINEDYKRYAKEYESLTKGFIFDGQFHSTKSSYRRAINKGIQAVSSGETDYYTQIRKTVSELGGSGIKVVYDSGYSRRLDSSVRMNILDGVRDVNSKIREQQGKEFDADGYEISVHGLSAPDHVNIQGKQYTFKEYKELNESLKRKIGTLNCHHFATPIIIGVSEPNYTKEQLSEFKENSAAQHEFKNKTFTGYETTQKQRSYELKLRKLKEQQIALTKCGDVIGAKRTQMDIAKVNHEYDIFSKEVGLRTKPKRASVPNYKRMKFD